MSRTRSPKRTRRIRSCTRRRTSGGTPPVGSDQLLHAWQDEGLAEYSALLYFEESGGYGFTREGLLRAAKGMYNAYYSVRMQVFGEADTPMDRALSDFGEYEYVALTYAKGRAPVRRAARRVGG